MSGHALAPQQASEKAVKAVFYKLNADAWGHSVTALLLELARHFPVAEALIKAAKNLDKFYLNFAHIKPNPDFPYVF